MQVLSNSLKTVQILFHLISSCHQKIRTLFSGAIFMNRFLPLHSKRTISLPSSRICISLSESYICIFSFPASLSNTDGALQICIIKKIYSLSRLLNKEIIIENKITGIIDDTTKIKSSIIFLFCTRLLKKSTIVSEFVISSKI